MHQMAGMVYWLDLRAFTHIPYESAVKSSHGMAFILQQVSLCYLLHDHCLVQLNKFCNLTGTHHNITLSVHGQLSMAVNAAVFAMCIFII